MRQSLVRLAIVLFAALAPRLAHAQTLPTDNPVLRSAWAGGLDGTNAALRRIWTIGMDSSRTMQLAHALLDSVGPRLTATPGHNAGNEWLARMYRSWGIEANIERYGTWRGWRRGTSHIDMMTPRVRTLEGTMVGYSAGTGGRAVTAEAVVIPVVRDSAEFVRWLPSAQGKFVLIGPAAPTCRPQSDWTQFATAESRTQMDSLRARTNRAWTARANATGYAYAPGGTTPGRLGQRLDAAGVAGVVMANPTDFSGTYRVFQTNNTRSPTVILSCEDFGLVSRLAESGARPTLRMDLDAELLGTVPASNTIGTIRGTLPNEYVMMSAHFDSWDGASGATDNGTGTLVMMEAMRILKLAYPNPKRTIMVGHWSGEEQGLIGSRAWTEDHPEVLRGLQALFNQDNGTGRIRTVSGSGGLVGIDQHLQSWRALLPREFTDSVAFRAPAQVPGQPGGTDGAVFACKATPSFGLGALNWNYNQETWHTNRDSFDKVVFDDLRYNATLTAMLVYLASEDPSLISRQKLPGNFPDCGLAPREFRAP
jgi:carboxypeptidase Q